MNVHQAKSQLSKLLDAAEKGEDVYVTRRDRRFQITLAPVTDRPQLFGSLRHLFPPGWMEEYDRADEQFSEELEEMINAPIFPERDS
ncbi:MAG: type II toxin-antitoxin system Phd/YefM family antitoxin [Rhodoglobus sp.]